MNHNRLYFLLLLFAFSLGIPGLAQKRCISQDWNFCRIFDETSKAEIKNQEVTGVHNTMCSTWI